MTGRETIRVAVVGAAGRMGAETCRALLQPDDLELVAAIDRRGEGQPLSELVGPDVPDVPLERRLGEALDRTKPDVLVDFTNAGVAPDHALSAIARGVSPIIGATGLSDENVRTIRTAASDADVPTLLAPNFAIGAVLMVRFAQMAARYMPAFEMVELHHDEKLDAPSGTAIHTARKAASEMERRQREPVDARELYKGARGSDVDGVRIHSIRLPGLVAHHRAYFGNEGEMLTISHDSMDRRSFMAGVLVSIRRVRSLEGLVIGLDQVLFDD